MVKQNLEKSFCICQNNYIRTNYIRILEKNEANEVYNQLIVNHLKILNSQKLSCLVGLFALKSFHRFVSLALIAYVTDCLSSVLFCIIFSFFFYGR